MKRLAVDLADLASRENLLLAVFKAARGKRHRPEVEQFLGCLEERLRRLRQQILEERVPLGRDRQFVIHDPKRRLITAPCFEDRVLHHAVFNLAEPRLETSLTPVAFACRPGRGVHAAVWAVQGGLRRFPWVVQVDVEHYFDNICHQRLMSLLARRFKGQGFLALLQRMVQAAGSDGRGLPIGSLASQHFANAYLDSADRLLLDQPGVGAAVRYMDDMVWFCRSKEQARRSLAVLRDHVEGELGLRLKDRVVLKPSAQGLSFCGWRVRQGVVLPGLRKLRRYRAACRRLKAAEAAGTAPVLLQRVHDAAAAALLPGSSQAFRRRLWWGAGL